jgi:hypothetical protein
MRHLRRPWDTLISERGLFVPKIFEDHKTHFLKVPDIKINKKTFYLSDAGREALSQMLNVLCALSDIQKSHTRQEVYECLLKEYEAMWNRGFETNLLDEINEFLPRLLSALKARVQRRRFYARVTGVRLEGLDRLVIGRVVLRSCNDELKAGLRLSRSKENNEYFDTAVAPFIAKNFENGLCLEGEYEADAKKSEELFDSDCRMAISLLRLILCSWAPEKIHLIKAPLRLWADAPSNRRTMLSVDTTTGGITLHWKSNIDTEGPLLNPENLEILRRDWFWDDLCKILTLDDRNELEDIIVNGIKWIGDAQDDSDIASAFVKYWTCLEGAFSGHTGKTGIEKASKKKEMSLSERLARSIAIVLVFGGYQFYKAEEFDKLFANIKQLYAIRSDVVHRGRSKHLTSARLAEICTYAVYVIFTLLGLRSRGYTTRQGIEKQTERIYERTQHAQRKGA